MGNVCAFQRQNTEARRERRGFKLASRYVITLIYTFRLCVSFRASKSLAQRRGCSTYRRGNKQQQQRSFVNGGEKSKSAYLFREKFHPVIFRAVIVELSFLYGWMYESLDPSSAYESERACFEIGSFPIFNLFYYFIITLFIVEFSKYPAKYQKKISLVLTLSNIRIVATIFIRVWIFLEYRFTNRFLNSLS